MLFRLVTLLLAYCQVAQAGVKCVDGNCPWWLRGALNSCCDGHCWVLRASCSWPAIGGMSDQIQDEDIPRMKAEAAAKLIGGMSQPQAMNMIAEMLDVVVDKQQPAQGSILGMMSAGADHGAYDSPSGGYVGAMSPGYGVHGGPSGGYVGAMSPGHGVHSGMQSSYPHSMCKYQSTKDGCNYFGCNNMRCPCMWEATYGVPGGRCMISDHSSNYDYPFRG